MNMNDKLALRVLVREQAEFNGIADPDTLYEEILTEIAEESELDKAVDYALDMVEDGHEADHAAEVAAAAMNISVIDILKGME